MSKPSGDEGREFPQKNETPGKEAGKVVSGHASSPEERAEKLKQEKARAERLSGFFEEIAEAMNNGEYAKFQSERANKEAEEIRNQQQNNANAGIADQPLNASSPDPLAKLADDIQKIEAPKPIDLTLPPHVPASILDAQKKNREKTAAIMESLEGREVPSDLPAPGSVPPPAESPTQSADERLAAATNPDLLKSPMTGHRRATDGGPGDPVKNIVSEGPKVPKLRNSGVDGPRHGRGPR